ncbi:hypothetical protein [Holzapfeliella floricola]|uniref:Uncharacterized protein n=1 Tax=Holzapfeliella floricola DSM 23037 = JCM 16512 TaxID=1423744 RepID=A0A0R2DJR4_9LACO|nr:hypothetical protein [Holzapfeliella floricola]KRN03699.1 hypothetical protein FC86_GL000806 [Holzapfeliella floricola DSM 23037 = JCM 16512]
MNKGILSLGLVCLMGVSLVGCSANSTNQTENNHEQVTDYIDKTSTELLNQSKIGITYKSVSKTEPSMIFDIKTEPLTKEKSDTTIEYRQNGRLLESTATNDKQVNTKNYHVTLQNNENPVTLSIYLDSAGFSWTKTNNL